MSRDLDNVPFSPHVKIRGETDGVSESTFQVQCTSASRSGRYRVLVKKLQ